jgi:hypothetical protein
MEHQNRNRPHRTYTIAPKTIDRLDQIAKQWGVSKSSVIDMLVRQEAERMGIQVSEKVEAG